MADNSQKEIPKQDMEQAIRYAYNNNEKTLSVNGFLAGKVGHKIVVTPAATTDQFDYYDGAFLISSILITYSDNTKAQMISAERIA